MITWSQPVWLLLLIPLGVALYGWPLPTRWLRTCRILLLTAIVLALCHPALHWPDRAGTVVVVADRSDSMPPGSAGTQKEIVNLLHKSMGPRDQLAVVSFGHEALVERPPQRAEFGGFSANLGVDQSNLHDGLETALGLISPGSPGRILVLSDGKWTGKDPLSIAARAAERGLALDYRLLSRPQVNEIAIHQFQAPQTVAAQEALVLNAWVHSPTEQEVRYQLLRGSQIVASGQRKVSSGLNRLLFRDRAGDRGTLAYQLAITGPEADPCPENNQARALVGIRGTRPILAVSEAGTDSGLSRLLQAGGMDLISRKPAECRWNLEDLAPYSAIILENLLASHLGGTGLETVASWIEQTGSGLLLTGGKKSFGPGGYFRSPLERIIPISMEMRQEHRKSRLAIVVTLDRSGSMAMSAGGGRTKMELANLGTVQVLDLLTPLDEIGVVAVDSSPHIILELNTVEKNLPLRNKLLAIDSMGGGIFIFEALSAAARMLMQAQADTKHILLFADAADSEEPGRYEELLRNCRQANITVSVVGLGTLADVDAPLLQDIARLGEGNCYFSDSPYDIPRLFAQDTFTVARSSFIEEVTPIKVTAAMTTLGGPVHWQAPALGGYNLCYARPEALLAAVTTDEYAAPVVAGWQAGSGRVLCFTGEADGQYSGAMAQWSQVGDFYSTLVQWAAGKKSELPNNMLLTQDLAEGYCRLELHLDPGRDGEPFAEPPQVSVLHGLPGQAPGKQNLNMRWSSADTVEAQIPIRGRETILATVTVPGFTPVTLSPLCLPYSPEFKPDPTGRGIATLIKLASTTGGGERIDLAKIWKDLPVHLRRVSLAPWLILAALLLFLAEIFQRRTGFFNRWIRSLQDPLMGQAGKILPAWGRFRLKKPSKPSLTTIPAQPKPNIFQTLATSPPTQTLTSPTPAPTASTGTLAAMRHARQRAKGRQGDCAD